MRISSVCGFLFTPSLRQKSLLQAGFAGVLIASGAIAPMRAQPAPSDAIQVPGARSAYSDSISAPIVPPAIPAPVKTPEADTPPSASAAGQPADARLVINDIRFSGNTVFSSQELAGLVAPSLGKAFSFAELQALAARVQSHYHARGYLLARVVIPQQDIGAARVLEFRVLEGWLGQVNVTGSHRFSEDRVRRTLLTDIKTGQPFKISDMERALSLLNKNSGIAVSSTLKAGDQAGSTNLEVEVKEEKRITGSVEVNNFGSKNTGEYRIIPAVSLPNLSGRGDMISAFGVFSPKVSDLYFGQVNYVTPVGVSGTSINAYFSQGNYQVGREFEVLEIEGENLAWGLGLAQDYIFSARTSLNLEAWFESSDMEQTMFGGTTSKDEIRKVRAGANLDQSDLRGRTFSSFHVHQGLGEALGGMDNDSTLSSRSFGGADNRFTKFVGSVTRLQSLHPRLFLLAHLSGQYAVDSVVAGEQIAIGGANSVRGHPQSAFAGDDGFVANLEARFSILPGDSRYQVAGFLDHGEVHTKDPIIGQKNWNRLSGGGVGVRVTVIEDLEVRADVAAPLGTKTDDDVYFYAQARFRF